MDAQVGGRGGGRVRGGGSVSRWGLVEGIAEEETYGVVQLARLDAETHCDEYKDDVESLEAPVDCQCVMLEESGKDTDCGCTEREEDEKGHGHDDPYVSHPDLIKN